MILFISLQAGHAPSHMCALTNTSTRIRVDVRWWAPCILETYIGNYVVWKHHLHLETWIGYWKQCIWKHKTHNENDALIESPLT